MEYTVLVASDAQRTAVSNTCLPTCTTVVERL